jgi:mannose-6-phosphate isomerase-like protein (cupin superfamily)
MNAIDTQIGARIRRLRGNATLDALATASGVSRAMLSRIERGESSATAQLQPVWRDPGTGYLRRAVSAPGGLVEIVEVTLPPGAAIGFENDRVAADRQQIWVLAGRLGLALGDVTHRLSRGDCLAMRFGEPVRFHNPTRRPARYAVIVERTRP